MVSEDTKDNLRREVTGSGHSKEKSPGVEHWEVSAFPHAGVSSVAPLSSLSKLPDSTYAAMATQPIGKKCFLLAIWLLGHSTLFSNAPPLPHYNPIKSINCPVLFLYNSGPSITVVPTYFS